MERFPQKQARREPRQSFVPGFAWWRASPDENKIAYHEIVQTRVDCRTPTPRAGTFLASRRGGHLKTTAKVGNGRAIVPAQVGNWSFLSRTSGEAHPAPFGSRPASPHNSGVACTGYKRLLSGFTCHRISITPKCKTLPRRDAASERGPARSLRQAFKGSICRPGRGEVALCSFFLNAPGFFFFNQR